jgi:hypothetical protein
MDTIITLLAFAFVYGVGYFIGYARALSSSISLTVEDPCDVKKSSVPALTIEKNGDQYYAYLDSMFITQSTNFSDLLHNMTDHPMGRNFTIDDTVMPGLPDSEREEMIKALMTLKGSLGKKDVI